MPLATTRRTGLVDQVIGQLRDAIAEGEWAIGQRIPTEAALAESLAVGRNTVREAERDVAHSGLLEVRQGDGTYVRATSEVSGAIRRLCGSELREVLGVRRALEVEAARLAATVRTEEELATITELLDQRDEAYRGEDIETYVRADTEFHLAVVRASHNALLTELYRGILEAVTASVAATTDTRLPETEAIGHRGLLEAIAARDTERAMTEAAGFLDNLIADA
ncbi:FadR/GntR family transcriptional regulator [Amycolatopsis thermalba]|uniref:FadR/GntR family transcriptional regulator n=1 Tax=Amycolatopsis thermalba TaxID=944492 RepID=UPI000E25186F|nr:FadR/GntR family transcriptional regulator [Amycolatopsis thermalba]